MNLQNKLLNGSHRDFKIEDRVFGGLAVPIINNHEKLLNLFKKMCVSFIYI